MTPAPGEIVLEHASRAFIVRADRARTVKELLIGRRGERSAPPPVHALSDVTLTIGAGEAVGLVGRNGAGKTSTLRALSGIVPLNSGRAECGGRVVSLLELGAGFGRDFSGRENIHLNGALHGLTRAEVEERIEPIIEFSELGDFIDAPVRTYSAGMYVRLGFAIAAHLDADVLLIDEVLAVGDEAFQRKCLRRIAEQLASGTTLVLVSHDASAIERVCRRVVVLDDGHVVFDGPTPEGLGAYRRLIGTDDGLEPEAVSAERAHVETRDSGDRLRSLYSAGEPMRIAVERAEAGPLRLEVRDEAGTVVFSTRADHAPARAVYEIPALHLLGGDYDVVCAGRATRFAIAREPGADGIVDLRGTWQEAVLPTSAP